MYLSKLQTLLDAMPSIHPYLSRAVLQRYTAVKTQQAYEQQIKKAIEDRYNGAITDAEFTSIMTALIAAQLEEAFTTGATDAGMSTLSSGLQSELDTYQQNETDYIAGLLTDIQAAIENKAGAAALDYRAEVWANRYSDALSRAKVLAGAEMSAVLIVPVLLRWNLGPTEHCADCRGYGGQVKTAQEWDDIYRQTGHKPQSVDLECNGYNCQCSLDVA